MLQLLEEALTQSDLVSSFEAIRASMHRRNEESGLSPG
jgi:hypothetical protein